MRFNYKKAELNKKDVLIIIIMAIIIWFVAALSLGFLGAGFDCMYAYTGADDFSITAQTKELLQENWVWYTERMGAPYGHHALEYSSICLQLPEFLMIKFWGIFTNDVPTVINLQFVFTFVLCGILAYVVLRKMTVGYILSIAGGMLYAFSPYLYARNIGHYCLTACYFVPLSIYLCYCCYFEDDFLKFDKTIFCKRTILILFMCFCIATNGIGYYPFFTCFYLAVTALCKFLKTGKWRDVLSALKVIVVIGCLFAVALLPVIIHGMFSEVENITSRIPSEMEAISLKITQLFVPIYSHGIESVQRFINEYNANMPLVNENAMVYLGVVGCIGFIVSMLLVFGMKKDSTNDEDLFFLARLNLAAVLVMSVGGFISLLTVALRMYALRGFNRISIFISFCSIAILCLVIQKYVVNRIQVSKEPKARYALFCICVGLVVCMGVWEQTPKLFNSGKELKVNKVAWDNDAEFISEIENQLQRGDMIYQLPYHKYPEMGCVNKMNDYQLLAGYIHSESLKWSYGGFKGGDGDRWNEAVSYLDIPSLIEIITASGFRGIYIESRAYTEEELAVLLDEITNVLGYQPMVSNDGKLFFYSLYPYVALHPEVLELPALTTRDLEYPLYVNKREICFAKKGYNATQYIVSGMSGAEEEFSWTQDTNVDIRFNFYNAKSRQFVGTIECVGVFSSYQNVEIIVNERSVYEGRLEAAKNIVFEGNTQDDGKVEMTMILKDCISPKAVGVSEDSRDLALAIKSMKFELK